MKLKVLSLFDGMSCGMLAMIAAGIEVERYDAYEIDKYAVQVSTHNFPQIRQHGDVFKADFTEYEGYDFLVGGSPCTYWSIAQSPDKRETTASGIGWELFSQYVRALREAQPRMFIYENNKSMSKDIRASITETFGFEPICINSALVSAQNRQRLYWVGVRQDGGTYRKAGIGQPADRGILLKDVLDSAVAWRDKAHAEIASQYKGQSLERHLRKGQRNLAAEPVALQEQPYGRAANADGKYDRRYEAKTDGKSPALTSVESRRIVAEPLAFSAVGDKDSRKAGTSNKAYCLAANPSSDMAARVIEPVRIGTMPRERDDVQTQGQAFRIYDPDGKSITLKGNTGGGGGKTGLYATQETPAKDQKVYTVADGQIEVDGKRYPIKLKDGKYIIRKLTVTECMRLQTVPEWYDFSCVSNTQAYKMLGNGWTVEVIAHLIRGAIQSAS